MFGINRKEVIVLGDKTTHGGEVISASDMFFYGDTPVARVGDRVTCPRCNGTHEIIEGAPFTFDNDEPVARHGDAVSCGARLIAGTSSMSMEEALKMDDIEKVLLCIPDIAVGMAEKAGDTIERQGWLYLHDMMEKWLSGPVNRDATKDDDPFFVDWDWVMQLPQVLVVPGFGAGSYTSPQEIYKKFTGFWENPDLDIGSNIYNVDAQKSLGKILARKGWPETFDFISSPWQEWQDNYHTLRLVPQSVGIDGQQAALGSFTLRALAKGRTEKIRNGEYTITVTDAAVFAYDIYNFAPGGIEWLAYWSCTRRDVAIIPGSEYSLLHNKDFRRYQDTCGLGHDYLVLSEPHLVENFTGMEYPYWE